MTDADQIAYYKELIKILQERLHTAEERVSKLEWVLDVVKGKIADPNWKWEFAVNDKELIMAFDGRTPDKI